mgnify:CR=1 FL=1
MIDFVSQQFKAFRLRFLWHDKAPLLVDQFVKKGRVLDVGCGPGHLMHALARRGVKTFGVDISAAALDRDRLADVRAALGSA